MDIVGGRSVEFGWSVGWTFGQSIVCVFLSSPTSYQGDVQREDFSVIEQAAVTGGFWGGWRTRNLGVPILATLPSNWIGIYPFSTGAKRLVGIVNGMVRYFVAVEDFVRFLAR